jgi:hypothetical protein
MKISNRDMFGEVFTPEELINEMLDRLPINVWKNKDLKWLDPCAGNGNFFRVVIDRLMDGLIDIIPDPIKRKEHIIENMLYMIEINENHHNDLLLIFSDKSNIAIQDFLSYDNPFKYDIIIGNPPYQSMKLNTYVGSVAKRTLWDKFLLKSFEILNTRGYIGFITPSNWRRPCHKLYSQMTKLNELLYLHIYNKKDGLKYFNAQTRFDLYIITNDKMNKNPIIIDEKGLKHNDINLSIWPFLPNYSYDIIKPYLKESGGLNVIYDSSFYDARKLVKEKNSRYKYPIIHTLTKKGIGIRYSDKINVHINIPKVILNVNEKQYPVNDFYCKYGMSQLSFGIPIKSFDHGTQLIAFIESPTFKEIINATKWSSFQTDYRMFKFIIFPDVL